MTFLRAAHTEQPEGYRGYCRRYQLLHHHLSSIRRS
jgi:hypothetical protein